MVVSFGTAMWFDAQPVHRVIAAVTDYSHRPLQR